MGEKRSSLRAIATETLAILDRGAYMAPSGRTVSIGETLGRAVDGVRLYRPGELGVSGLPSVPERQTRIEVTGETTLTAAHRIRGAGEVACLNFASAKNPGGGFRNGAQAQEESLARASGLYATLLAAPDYYDIHRTEQNSLYSDHLIYAPSVPVFRDDSGMLLEEPYQVAFITSPAPNRGATRDLEVADSIPDVLTRRSSAVLAAAIRHGHEHLVLGAWGCGVFRNDPDEVADAFGNLLIGGLFENRFAHVVFAVFDPEGKNRPAFEHRFGNL